MIPGRVSVVIPTCNERFLQPTIDSLLGTAHGDVEIYAVLDGGPDQAIREDKRVIMVRHKERVGMRETVNRLASSVSGEFLMKCDGHCLFGLGWDTALKGDCDGDWVAVPTRHSIDGKRWRACGPSGRTVNYEIGGYNYHYMSFAYAKSLYGYGLHGVTFPLDINNALNIEARDRPIDDLMSFQGSCWFTPTANFLRLGPLDQTNYNFYAESIEVGMRQWISGGRVVINKKTWQAHYHKGANNLHTIDGRVGRGFYLSLNGKRAAEAYATDYWMNDRMPGAARTFAWFVAHFWDLLQRIPNDHQWPADWADPKYRVDFLNRPPEEIPAHL